MTPYLRRAARIEHEGPGRCVCPCKGYHWIFSPVAAYNASIQFVDGTSANLYRQRPKVLVDPHTHRITHLFTGVMAFPMNGSLASSEAAKAEPKVGISGPKLHDFSWTMVVPLNT